MLFQTPEFLVLMTAVLVGIVLLRTHTLQLVMLLAASYIFYMWWNPAYILLIIASTMVDYLVGLKLGVTEVNRARKRWLVVSVAANLTILGVFKYFNFFAGSLNHLFTWTGASAPIPHLNVLLPVGISFYTFQSMSYTIDVYRKQIKPERSLLRFALYVAFFPQLVAGPILRAKKFIPQLYRVVNLDSANLRSGFHLVLSGLFKKVVIADNVSPLADSIFGQPQGLPSPVIWVGTIAFTIQLYCDFAGYSDIAIGLGRMMGYDIPKNFNYPYFSKSITELWTRWHISLSTWFRDYLYLSLPGSRTNITRAHINLVITMVLVGLWHGAGWNFILFGTYFGVMMVLEYITGWNRLGRRKPRPGGVNWNSSLAQVFRWAVTMYFIFIGFILFRVHNVPDLFYILKKYILFDFKFQFGTFGLAKANPFLAGGLALAFIVLHTFSWRVDGIAGWLDRLSPGYQRLVYATTVFAMIWLWPTETTSYVYFQF